jgi:hypothetical protein
MATKGYYGGGVHTRGRARKPHVLVGLYKGIIWGVSCHLSILMRNWTAMFLRGDCNHFRWTELVQESVQQRGVVVSMTGILGRTNKR